MIDTLQEQHQLIPSHLVKTGLVLPLEHLAADTANLHSLVVYYVTAALPMEQLHQRAVAVEKYIHRTASRILTGTTNYPAKKLNPLTQIHRIAVDHKLIRFIQTKT